MTQPFKHKVTVIGGGTGIFPVTQALQRLSTDICSIIAVSDSGGSTGRIRDEFGFQPVGDLRQSLAALAEDEAHTWIRQLLLYRFNKGSGLKGHNLGNLILTALQDMTGSTSEALFQAQRIFRIDGTVIPATQQDVDLKIKYQDGTVVVGEDSLNEQSRPTKKIDRVSLVPNCRLSQPAKLAIQQAELIVIGPGDLYGSVLAALAPSGVRPAFKNSSAEVMYVVNLMTSAAQTHNMTAAQHLTEVEKAVGKRVDHVLINSARIPPKVIKLYQANQEFPVEDDLGNDQRAIRADVISQVVHQPSDQDNLKRSLLRHDSAKLEQVFAKLLKDTPV
ncbi:MAG: hypothetical protein COU69_01825 [Candidatus Pacebacteria bacterium CG10_big_fil_rev_8_21_14_0_10_56_10]|nr:MAG: hypothetical protein COU69_01825 [Candidatus Pacebacteria bacterium CG10_big_fil_rev_8_21_14_0_10_56_10]